MTPIRAALILCAAPALALLLGGIALAWAVGQGAAADAAQARLQQGLAQNRLAPVIRAEGLLLPGRTQGLAASALQAQVLGLVEGAEVQQIEPRGAVPEGALTRLRLTLTLAGAEAQVMQGLIRLEQAEPLLFVDGLRLRAGEAGAGGGDGSGDGAGDGSGDGGGTLVAEIDLSAYAGQVAP